MERLPSGLIVAKDVAYLRDEVFFCTVCSGERLGRGDDPLGFTKHEAEQYQRHVIDCANQHEEELRELSLRERAPGVFGDEGWDVEFEQWVRDNADAIKEGRLKL